MTNQPDPRILIVDDESFMRTTVRSMLRVAGRFTVQEAADGAAALDAIAAFRPDLVLCDIGMRPMGGLAFVETLRCHSDETRRATPVIMLTAKADEGTVQSAARLRLDGYLLKPVSPEKLGALVRGVLAKRNDTPSFGSSLSWVD